MENRNGQCSTMNNNLGSKFQELQGNLLSLITSNPTWLTYSIKDRICLYRIDVSNIPTLVVSVCVNRDMSVQVFKDKSEVNFRSISSILGDNDMIQDLSQLSTLLSYYTDVESQNIKSSPTTVRDKDINNADTQKEPYINDFSIAVCYDFADFPTNNHSQSSMVFESEHTVVDSNGDLHAAESPRSTTDASNGSSYFKPCPLSFKRKRTDDNQEICDDTESGNKRKERKDSNASSDNVAETSSASNGHSNLDEGGLAQEVRSLNKTVFDIGQQNEAMKVAICELTSVLKEVTNKRPSLRYTNNDAYLPSNQSVTATPSAFASSVNRVSQSAASSLFSTLSPPSTASPPTPGDSIASGFEVDETELFSALQSEDQKKLARVLRTCRRQPRSKMVNDIMKGLFDLDYMCTHTVTEVTGDKQPMDKLLLMSIIRSVQAQYPTATEAEIKLDMRQKLNNAVKTAKRKVEKNRIETIA